MMDLLEYGVRFENLVFQNDNIPESCLMVYSKDRSNITDDECWVVNCLNTNEVKELVKYLELYLKKTES